MLEFAIAQGVFGGFLLSSWSFGYRMNKAAAENE